MSLELLSKIAIKVTTVNALWCLNNFLHLYVKSNIGEMDQLCKTIFWLSSMFEIWVFFSTLDVFWFELRVIEPFSQKFSLTYCLWPSVHSGCSSIIWMLSWTLGWSWSSRNEIQSLSFFPETHLAFLFSFVFSIASVPSFKLLMNLISDLISCFFVSDHLNFYYKVRTAASL